MKYFSTNYWIKLWLLSAPLFNSKNEGIYAKSIANKNIKDWASNNTDLQLIENQTINLSNNQSIQLQNNENITSSKNLETDDFYENFLKTQGWSNNPEIAQQQLIEIKAEHHSFLKQKQEEIKRHKRKVIDNTNSIGTTTTARPNINDWIIRNPDLIRDLPTGYAIDPNIRNIFISWNNDWRHNQFAYYDTWDLFGNPENNGDFIINILNNSPQHRYLMNNWEENHGFRLISTYILGRVLHHGTQPLHGDVLRIGELFPYNVYNNYRNIFLTGNDNDNSIERWRHGDYRLTFDRYLMDNLNRNNEAHSFQDDFRSSLLAFRYLNNILNEAYLNNDHTVFRWHLRYRVQRFSLALETRNIFRWWELNNRHHVVLNTYRRTYNQILSRDFHTLIAMSLLSTQPFVFSTNIRCFPRSLFSTMDVPNRLSNNYFLIRATNRIYSEILERNHYQIYDPVNSLTYHIDGNHLMEIISLSVSSNLWLYFAFGYDAGIYNTENRVALSEIMPPLRNLEMNETFLRRWGQYINDWVSRNDNSDLECDNFESFTRSWNQRHARSINNNTSTCIINTDEWYWKLRNEKIYHVLTLKQNNQNNSRKIGEKFVSTDQGFYFVNLNNEIVKIGDFKKIIYIIADNQGSVYIVDELQNNYHINLYDLEYSKIKSNTMVELDIINNIILKLMNNKNENKPIITALHTVQESECNYETIWMKNDIFVGTDQGFYLYNYKEQILDKFSGLNIPIKNFQLTSNTYYAINQQGKKIDLDLFNPKNYYIPNYYIDPAKDFKEEYDAWGANNDLWLHISYDNVMYMIHSFLYNNKNNFVNYFLNIYLNKLNISNLFNENEKNNIVNSIWQNFPDFHEKSLNIHDGQSLVLHIDGKGNWLEDNIKIEEYHPQPIIIKNRENYNFKPAYEIEKETEDQQLQILGQIWHSNEVMFRISNYNIHQMFKSFIYNLKNDFVNNFIDEFLKKLSIKKVGSFLNRDNFYDDYYKGLANTIWNHFGDFHERALLVKPDQAIYFDMFALSGSLDGSLSIVKDHIHRYNIDCTRYTDSPSCHKQSNLLIKSKDQLLSKIRIYNENKNISKRATDNFINKIQKINSENFNNQTLLADELQNTTPWEKNITNLINHEQHLPIYNTTNFVKNNITSL